MQVATPRRARAISEPIASGLTSLEPLDDTAADGDSGHLASASEDHETKGGEFGRSRHTMVKWQDIIDEADSGVPVEIVSEPGLKSGTDERVADRIVFNDTAQQHHSSRKHRGEADAHLVEDDPGEYQEKHEHIEECLSALHGTEGLGIPTSGGLHKVLDRGKDVHEDVGAEHAEGQQQERDPPHRRRIPQSCFSRI